MVLPLLASMTMTHFELICFFMLGRDAVLLLYDPTLFLTWLMSLYLPSEIACCPLAFVGAFSFTAGGEGGLVFDCVRRIGTCAASEISGSGPKVDAKANRKTKSKICLCMKKLY